MLDPERAHDAAFLAGRLLQGCALLCDLLERTLRVTDPRLEVGVLGLCFPGPLGVAAGFDKNAELPDLLGALGFGHVEVGTVTAGPWPGNPRPRLFRLPADGAIINRMGLNNQGAAEVSRRSQARRRRLLVGINVGRASRDDASGDPVQDFVEAVRAVRSAADWITLNISCPNTSDGRTFEEPQALTRLLRAVVDAVGANPPLLVKFSPDLEETPLLHLVDICLAEGVAGLVLSNTTTRRAGLATSQERIRSIGRGGLSGKPLTLRAERLLARVRRHVGSGVPLVGVGGIARAEDAWRRIRAGAHLLGAYTSLVYEGPALARTIHEGLLRCMERDGFDSLSDAVGVDA